MAYTSAWPEGLLARAAFSLQDPGCEVLVTHDYAFAYLRLLVWPVGFNNQTAFGSLCLVI